MPVPNKAVIANPKAAGGGLGKRIAELKARVEGVLGPCDFMLTERLGHASELARQAAQRGLEIVVLGGDGTISEVVHGLLSERPSQAPTIGVLPQGTGGDLRRSLYLPKALTKALAIIAQGHSREVDVGVVEFTTEGGTATRHFANIASFGMSAMVDQLVNSSSKRLGGRIGFAWATMRAMRRYTPQLVELRAEGLAPFSKEIHTVAVANGRYFGGGMKIAPNAEIDDGLLDVVTIDPLTMGYLLRYGHLMYSGKHIHRPEIQVHRTERLEALPHSHQPILLDIDGETPGRLPAVFSVQPRALRVYCPPE